MRLLYFNFVYYQITAHHDRSCVHMNQAAGPGQRLVRVNTGSIGTALTALKTDGFPFSAAPGERALWLQIEFDGDHDFERAVQRYVHRLLGKRYPRFLRCVATDHC